MVPVFNSVGERFTAKSLLVFVLWLVKSLKNLSIIELFITNRFFFLICSMVLCLLI